MPQTSEQQENSSPPVLLLSEVSEEGLQKYEEIMKMFSSNKYILGDFQLPEGKDFSEETTPVLPIRISSQVETKNEILCGFDLNISRLEFPLLPSLDNFDENEDEEEKEGEGDDEEENE